ncbi:hypothetical protein BUE93_22080 [Chromobacterium amazonense]|uniref:P-type conjugative transfer protein VirB9 n=2 Tax=Chromobacterium amazonense TaxID=1382803 RepID=A0A2S9WYH8_9NEIS|nr:hypothetical protein BUE93_22080 [Chromobacterium amazonense]
MKVETYNPEIVSEVHVADGFVTQLIFDEGERILSKRSGFEAGWKLDQANEKPNILFIEARAVQQADATGAKMTYKPNPREWDTNLLVSTDKRNYVFNLHLVEARNKVAAYQIRFDYPQDRAKAQASRAAEAAAKQQELDRKQSLQDAFQRAETPKNWDYGMVIGKGSRNIAPDFAYDNGLLTYLGFLPGKNFPAPFIQRNGIEQIAEFSVEQRGDYRVMVLHNVSHRVILRHGQEVVGVVNQGFGKQYQKDQTTISDEVVRVEADGNGKS